MMTITYGGVDITKYLRPTRGLDRKILPNVDYRLERVGNADGLKHLGTSLGSRAIPMPFIITDELIKNRRALAEVLYTKEALPLIFSDEPDKVWFALPSGNINVDELVILGHGTIEWIIPDGVAHSTTPRTFTNVSLPQTAQNQVWDPEYKNKDKYYKVWTAVDNEKIGTSNVLMADLTEELSIVDNGMYKYDGLYIMQSNNSTGRNFPDLKQGDKVSAQVKVKIVKPSTVEPTAKFLLQELDAAGGNVIYTHELPVNESLFDEWQTLSLINVAISSQRTKALNLLVGMGQGSRVKMAQQQYNLGATLLPYSEAKTSLDEYIAVTNPGSYKTWPIIRAKMNGENGHVGLVNSNGGVLQFGNPEDFDIFVGKRTDKVISLAMRKSDGDDTKFEYNSPKAKPDYPNFLHDPSKPNKFQGSIDWDFYPDSCRPKFIKNEFDVWAGPTMYMPIPANNENKRNGDFIWRNRINFLTDVKQQGRLTMTLQNDAGPVLGFVIRDSSSTAANLIIEFWAFGKWVKTFNLDKKVWTGNFWEYTVSKTNGTNVEFKFSKWKAFSGEGITSSMDIIFPLNLPELANTNITGMTTWFAQARTVPTGLMDWTDNKFYWVNETEVLNIPNIFDDGDLLEIDVKNRRVMINGIENNYIHAIGNQWERFAIEPGTITVLPVASTWARMYELEIELRGAYI